MTTPADPRTVQPGQVVRVRLGGHVYSSPIMCPAEARAEHDRVAKALKDTGGAFGTFPFATVDGRDVAIRARSVSAVEVGPPPAHKDVPAASVVVVHLHVGDDVDEETKTAAEAAVAAAPTPLVLAGRKPARR